MSAQLIQLDGAKPHARIAGDLFFERERQITEEGYTPARDDRYPAGALESAAACYAFGASLPDKEREHFNRLADLAFISQAVSMARRLWPAGWVWPRLKDRRRDLVRAGGIIIAAIERIDREAERRVKGAGNEPVQLQPPAATQLRMTVHAHGEETTLMLDAYDAGIASELAFGVADRHADTYRRALAGELLGDNEVTLLCVAHRAFEPLPPLWPGMFTPRGVKFFPAFRNTYTLDRDIAAAICARPGVIEKVQQ